MMRLGLFCVALAAPLAGCVTINIYFPAAAAEKAADRIIEEVYQLRRDGATPPSTAPARPADSGTPK
jgi:hypothetical protein